MGGAGRLPLRKPAGLVQPFHSVAGSHPGAGHAGRGRGQAWRPPSAPYPKIEPPSNEPCRTLMARGRQAALSVVQRHRPFWADPPAVPAAPASGDPLRRAPERVRRGPGTERVTPQCRRWSSPGASGRHGQPYPLCHSNHAGLTGCPVAPLVPASAVTLSIRVAGSMSRGGSGGPRTPDGFTASTPDAGHLVTNRSAEPFPLARMAAQPRTAWRGRMRDRDARWCGHGSAAPALAQVRPLQPCHRHAASAGGIRRVRPAPGAIRAWLDIPGRPRP